MKVLLIFACMYCKDFKLTYISVAVPVLSFEIVLAINQNEVPHKIVYAAILHYCLLVFLFEIMRIGINLPGKNIVKNKVMRAGFEKLLNNLDESVIIAHRKFGHLLFVNSAALLAKDNFTEPICEPVNYESMQMSFAQQSDAFSIFNLHIKQFSRLDMTLLNAPISDPEQVREHIQNLRQEISFS